MLFRLKSRCFSVKDETKLLLGGCISWFLAVVLKQQRDRCHNNGVSNEAKALIIILIKLFRLTSLANVGVIFGQYFNDEQRERKAQRSSIPKRVFHPSAVVGEGP